MLDSRNEKRRTILLIRLAILAALSFFAGTANVAAQTTTINLSDFGSVGNGIADDGPALQAALNALATAGGGTLLVPAGKYAIATPVSKDFTGLASQVNIKGVASTTTVDTTGDGAHLSLGLDLTSEFYPRVGQDQTALKIVGLDSFLIKDIAFVGTPDVLTDATYTLVLDRIEDGTIDHCEFYGLSALHYGSIVLAIRSRLRLQQSKFLGCATNSASNSSVVENIEWKAISVSNCVFVDYGQRPELYGKLGYVVPYSWINFGNALSTTNDSPRRQVKIHDLFLDEGSINGLSCLPNRYNQPSATIDLIYITRLRMNVSNLGASGNYFNSVNAVFVENSLYGWSHFAAAAINVNGVQQTILDKLECIADANRIIAGGGSQSLTVINSVYSILSSEAPITNVITTQTPEEDPVQFVRQRFQTVLGREPDAAGHFYWSRLLLQCGPDAGCLVDKKGLLNSYLNSSPASNFSITGQVTGDNGSPLSDALVTLNGSQTASTLTNVDGNYSFGDLPTSGVYNVTVSKALHTFDSPTATITYAPRDQTLNFSGSLDRYVIQGVIRNMAGESVAGATVTLAGFENATTTSAIDGNYSFVNVPAGGTYTLTPSNSTFVFSPANQTVTNLQSDQTVNFNLVTKKISGRVTKPDGAGLSGVTITLSGSSASATTTDQNGNYSFVNLPAGGTYTLTPSNSSLVFSPANQTVTNLQSDQTVNFAIVTHTIMGIVSKADGSRMPGAVVTLLGPSNYTQTTDSGGNYAFTNVPAGASYTMTVAKANYSFSPAAVMFGDLATDEVRNFTAQLNFGVPVLVTSLGSTRAIALDAVTHENEPFQLNYDYSWGTDNRTRIILFAENFALAAGEGVETVTADADDASGRHYDLRVEWVGTNNPQSSLTSIVVRLADNMGDVGDVLVRITYRGIPSNRVRLGIGHVGGGPPDDNRALPAPTR